jgi:P-type Cu+ transporter
MASMLAGLAMAMSSVTVVGNSILLGRYKPKFASKKIERLGESHYNDHFKQVLCTITFTNLVI